MYGVTEDEAEESEELPTLFVAFTVNVRAVPIPNPLNVVVKTLPTVTGLPTDGVIVYPVIAEPLEAGAVHETVADALPATAEIPVGMPGTVIGVTDDEAEESEELPTLFVAFTLNVTAVPFVRPVTVVVRTFPTVTGVPADNPIYGVTVYPVIADPLDAGAVQETVAEALPATAEMPVGVPGTVAGVTAADAKEGEELFTEFMAVTVNVTAVPLVRPVTVAVRTFPTVTALPDDGVTVYPVIAEPPFDAGALQETIADALPATAETPVGAPGTVAGVTAADAEESEELPTAFVAFTLNVMGVPFVRPVSVAVRTLPTVTGVPGDVPTYGVTVYPVIAEPPDEAGAVHETVADALPATAETPVGEPGVVTGVTGAEAEEAVELPIAFIASTVNVTEVPLVRPVTEAVRTFPTVSGLPVDGVTVYPVIAEPPFDVGAVQETVADALPATAETPVGALATETGVTEADAEDDKELPFEFVATTVNVSAVPPVKPVSVVVRTLPTVTGLPTDGVTVYPVIADPLEAGAVQETVAEFVPATAETPVGAPGTVAGVTAADAEEGEELFTEFIATTVNVTAVPLVRPVTVAVRTFPTVTALPEDGVTVYPVIAEPPFDTGAVQDTVANALPATAETPVGAPGTVAGVTEADAEESEELPTAFVAFTVNVRGVPLVRPVKLAVRTLPTVNGVPGVNPTYGVTVYAVIADPPEAGAVQETVAVVLPATAETPVGASGTVTGVTDDDAIESKELP